MRKIVAAAAVFVLTSSVCYGQEVTPTVAAGTKALLFEFDGLNFIRANNFQGGAGLKYFLSEMTAIRGSLQLAKANRDILTNPVAPNTGVNGSQDATTIGASVALERHLRTARLSPYYGGGVAFSTTSTESKNALVGNPPGAQTTIKNNGAGENIGGVGYQGGSNIGVFGLMGFEFFVTKDVSFSAEYRLGFTNTSQKDQEVAIGTTTTTTKTGSIQLLGIASSGVFTMAVYF